MFQQQQHRQQKGISSSKPPDLEAETSSPNQQGRHCPRHGHDNTNEDPMREDLLPSSSLETTARAGGRDAAATNANDVPIPIVGVVAESDSPIAAEEHEDRLQETERHAAATESAQQSTEAERSDHEGRLAQPERQMANESSNNNSGGKFSPKQLPQRQRC
jgi:hypothetical protein